MSDNVLSRFAPRLAASAATAAEAADLDGEEDRLAFGYLRGVKERSLMLEARLKDGRIVALSYALLDRATFDPDGSIALRFTGQEVRIRGLRLNEPAANGLRLFDLILRHRLVWVREASRADAFQRPASEPLIESIELKPER